ncbi:BTAD domain-containing putative transcriptional regulator [Microtetraspora fusca]|uniref:BTAD domain-containing putative transcriptional regulator n=1 Tax=Microtetraspora fusca TaxID=1997 RepID=A0ABW6VM30_MICFU
MSLSFRLLGNLEVWTTERRLEITARMRRALLALLLVDVGRAVPADALVERLWGDRPPSAPFGTLQAYVAQLRQTLEPERRPRDRPAVLLTRGTGYLLDVAPERIDALAFEDLVARGDLEAAFALWRGEPLAEFADAAWAGPYRTRLMEVYEAAAEDRVEAWLTGGRTESAVAELESMIARQPLRERRWAQLVRALYADGRQADALAAYRRCQTLLADELGIDPGPELRRLEAAVLAQDPSLPVGGRWKSAPAAPDTAESTPDEPVGRERELAVVRDRVEGLRIAGGCLLLAGEPGVGKTTLAESARRFAAASGVPATWVRCVDATSAPAYWPWAQVLRDLGGPAANAALGVVTGERPLPQGDRFQVYEAVLAALAAVPERRLVVFEDAHGADASSLELLRLIAGDLARLPFLFVVTSRDGAGLATPAVERLTVGVLPEEACARYVERALPGEPELASELARRSGGNPFFLGELVSLVRGGGTVGGVPEGVRDVIAQRVSALPERTREALTLAAVAGEALDPAVLAQAARMTGEELLVALDPALGAGLLVEDADSWGYRFRHGLIRDALYDSLGRVSRGGLHARVADALEATGAGVTALALHYLAAGPLGAPEKSVRYARAAAALAVRQTAWSEAVAHLREAAAVLIGSAELPMRCDVLVDLGRALRDAGEHAKAHEAIEEAVALATAIDDPTRVIAAATAFGGVTTWGSREYGEHEPAVVGFLESQLGATAGDDAARVRILATLGLELRYSDRVADCAAYAEQALDLARRLDDPDLLALAFNAFLHSCHGPSHFTRTPPVTIEAIDLAARRGARRDEFAFRLQHVTEVARAGDLTALDVQLARCRDLAAELRSPELSGQLRLAEATAALLSGRCDDAERLRDEGLRLIGLTGAPGLTWARLATDIGLARARGTLAAMSDPLLGMAESVPWSFSISRPAAVLALAESGREDEARGLTARWFAPPPEDWTWMFPMGLWSAVSALIGVPDPGLLYARLLPHAGELAIAGVGLDCGGSVNGLLAGLAAAMGDKETARDHARRAVETEDRLGLVAWSPRSRSYLS